MKKKKRVRARSKARGSNNGQKVERASRADVHGKRRTRIERALGKRVDTCGAGSGRGSIWCAVPECDDSGGASNDGVKDECVVRKGDRRSERRGNQKKGRWIGSTTDPYPWNLHRPRRSYNLRSLFEPENIISRARSHRGRDSPD